MSQKRSVAAVYRTGCRAQGIKPLKSIYKLLATAAGSGDAEGASMETIESLDVSGTYVGNRQLKAIITVATRCPNLRRFAMRSQRLFAADVLIHEAATSGDDSIAAVRGSSVVEFLAHELDLAAGYRAEHVALELDLGDNELGADAARHLLVLCAQAPFITKILLDKTHIDSTLVFSIQTQCEKNALRV